MTISEFPLAADVAADAAARGEHIVMGAPNIIRGGSHMGALSAEDAVRNRVCTVLASDYYYPSQLHAAEQLVARGVCTMAEAWRLLSKKSGRGHGAQRSRNDRPRPPRRCHRARLHGALAARPHHSRRHSGEPRLLGSGHLAGRSSGVQRNGLVDTLNRHPLCNGTGSLLTHSECFRRCSHI